jgi:hypothetical protein
MLWAQIPQSMDGQIEVGKNKHGSHVFMVTQGQFELPSYRVAELSSCLIWYGDAVFCKGLCTHPPGLAEYEFCVTIIR